MWTFIFLHIFGLSMCRPAEKVLGNSTQMYYSKLTIDISVLQNISSILTPFVSNTDLHVGNFQVTSYCQNETCSCAEAHKRSDEVCQSLQCCAGAGCSFQANPKQKCTQNTTVSVSGSLTLKAEDYQSCLTNSEGKSCSNSLLTEMKTVYSTLRGFDSLNMTSFSHHRLGDLMADFKMLIVFELTSADLIDKSTFLADKLSGVLRLETRGMVHLHMPTEPVRYEAPTELSCTSMEDLATQPTWSLKKPQGVFDVLNGTLSNVVTPSPTTTRVELRRMTELWAGEFTCVYQQKVGPHVFSHKASAELDVALLPDISVTTEPHQPRCEKSSGMMFVRAKCKIKKSAESYRVTWEGDGIVQRSTITNKHSQIYVADKIVSCDRSIRSDALRCTFSNRYDQNRSALIPINLIFEEDVYCPAEGEWGEAKADSTIVLRCSNSPGVRQRKCNVDGQWEEEMVLCVNPELDSVLGNAVISDSGLGSLEGNAVRVSTNLKNATGQMEALNSYANMNVSVEVMSTLGTKLTSIDDESTADDLLESSSNLLSTSFESSWNASADDANSSLAERYLSTVRKLIDKANLTRATQKKNLEVKTCDPSENPCASSVFNANISLRMSRASRVRTAGFRQLESYLPHDENSTFAPNSIVVSAATSEETEEPVEITIDFPFLTVRDRHVEMSCVSWDNSSRQWSPRGCKWAGPFDEARCVCNHLSSFAILMSKYPLEVPLIAEISYFGLSVSVVSLVVTLLVELVVWRHVIQTETLYIRHTAQVNIAVCLLVADCCFLASSRPHDISDSWCKTFVVLKHFCFLSMFFWMLSLSCTLLHQAVFLFHHISKKVYLRFSLVLGYVCPLLIVFISFLTNDVGAEGVYFSRQSCWLVYTGLMQGSIHTFVVPVGVVVFVNMFTMLVVIMKILDHSNLEKLCQKEKMGAKMVLRAVIILTPIFGVTWMIGLAVTILDLTYGPISYVVNYAFILLNAFQGFFILLTTCLADQMSRDALLRYFKEKGFISESARKMYSVTKWPSDTK